MDKKDAQKLYRLLVTLASRSTDPKTRGTLLHVLDVSGSVEHPIIISPLIDFQGEKITYKLSTHNKKLYLVLAVDDDNDDNQVYGAKIKEITLAELENSLQMLTNKVTQAQIGYLPTYLKIRQATYRH